MDSAAPNEKSFYKTVPLSKMNSAQWEALCDGCGLCCFRKFITGRGKNTKVHFTRIACDLLDLKTFRCTDYENRFARQKECSRLTKKNIGLCDWLPQTCSYRLLHNRQSLPDWHPLVSGSEDSLKESGILIKNPVHESDVQDDDWHEYEIDV